MKIFSLFSWICIVIAGICIACGFLDFIRGGGVFGLKHSSTFFTVANTFFLGALIFKFFFSGSEK